MNPIQMHTLALVAVLISITSSRAADNAVTNLPAGWTATDLGTVRKPGAVSYDAATKAFTIRTIGEAISSPPAGSRRLRRNPSARGW